VTSSTAAAPEAPGRAAGASRAGVVPPAQPGSAGTAAPRGRARGRLLRVPARCPVRPGQTPAPAPLLQLIWQISGTSPNSSAHLADLGHQPRGLHKLRRLTATGTREKCLNRFSFPEKAALPAASCPPQGLGTQHGTGRRPKALEDSVGKATGCPALPSASPRAWLTAPKCGPPHASQRARAAPSTPELPTRLHAAERTLLKPL